MKTKQQKREEAVIRAKESYKFKRYTDKGVSLEEYLSKFQPDREQKEYNDEI